MTSFQKILIGIVIVLVILNSLLLGFIWINRPSAREGFRPGNQQGITGRHLLKALDLNEQQTKLFKSEVRKHRKKMSSITSNLRSAKHQINQAILMEDTVLFANADSLHHVYHERMEYESQEFIRFISSLCTPEQRQKLIELQSNAKRKRMKP